MKHRPGTFRARLRALLARAASAFARLRRRAGEEPGRARDRFGTQPLRDGIDVVWEGQAEPDLLGSGGVDALREIALRGVSVTARVRELAHGDVESRTHVLFLTRRQSRSTH